MSLYSISASADVIVSNAWIRQVPPVATNTAAYFSLNNKTESDIHIVNVTTDVAESATMHDMMIENDMIRMVAIKSLLIRKNEKIEFVPGAKHLMLTKLKGNLVENQIININFEFKDGSKQVIPMSVRKLAPELNEGTGHHH